MKRTVLHFRSQAGLVGALDVIAGDPRHIRAVKRPVAVRVEFATAEETVPTREGPAQAREGDAILTAATGERWPVPRSTFNRDYEPLVPTRAGESGDYRKRPAEVRALKVMQPFRLTLADGVSELEGRAGDWLVDYGDGDLGVVGAAIFRKTYDPVSGPVS